MDIEDGQVQFQWKDYRDNNQPKTLTLDADEFIRRFLLHTLPEGFQRIRYYGLLGNRYRQQNLVEHLLRAGERRLGVKHPFRFADRRQVTGEFLRILKCLQRVEELQLAGLESLVEIFQKEPSEQTRQHAHREEKTGAAGDPATAIGRDSAARDNAVEMRMMPPTRTVP